MDRATQHRLIGIAIAVPLLLWALTGIVFLTKPGYEGAYDQLAPRTYSLTSEYTLSPDSHWREIRLLRTVLGDHLVVRDGDTWRHLDPATLQERPPPAEEALKALIEDAIASNPVRYGRIAEVRPGVITTDTGVEISLDWSRLQLTQRGRDTRLIDTLYRIHYLQWLGDPGGDRVLGVMGIVLLLALLLSGVSMHLARRSGKRKEAGRAERGL